MAIILSLEEMEIDAMQNKLMSKAEAIEAHAKTQANSMMEYYDVTQFKSKLFVEGLEALGLIEFKQPLVKLFEETTPDKGIVRLMKNENNSYTLWYHGQKVWGNE